ncbi:hypothetical protein ElyMa_002701500 [Elysia marginata]|uniref:Uncharacterized protein n=1 Tax=Elysia marginata TaxID=1093978 RepID=A0AAV4HF85_9GAST|nr:hypothetical protein ElyMa_002701500 [Elysia marginata]
MKQIISDPTHPLNEDFQGRIISRSGRYRIPGIRTERQIKLIAPLVPTSAYKVNFAKVMFETGHLMADMRVLEIEVTPLGSPDSILCPQRLADRDLDAEDESSNSWPVIPDEGYKLNGVRYVWENNKVKATN